VWWIARRDPKKIRKFPIMRNNRPRIKHEVKRALSEWVSDISSSVSGLHCSRLPGFLRLF